MGKFDPSWRETPVLPGELYDECYRYPEEGEVPRRRRINGARGVALAYAQNELGWTGLAVYGTQQDPVHSYVAVWLRGEVGGENATIGLLVDTSLSLVTDEFDPDEAGEPGKLSFRDPDPLGGAVYFG